MHPRTSAVQYRASNWAFLTETSRPDISSVQLLAAVVAVMRMCMHVYKSTLLVAKTLVRVRVRADGRVSCLCERCLCCRTGEDDGVDWSKFEEDENNEE